MDTKNEVTKAPAMSAKQRQANRQARLKADAERGRELRYQENSLNVLASEVLKRKRFVTIDLQQLDPARPFHCINDQLVYLKVEALAADLDKSKPTRAPKQGAGSHGDEPQSQVAATVKPRAKAVRSVTDATTKGSALSRRQRERVAK